MAPSTSTPATPAATKRLLHELRAYASDPNPALEWLSPVREDNLFEWEAGLRGPEGSWYEGATFPLRLTVPPTYPLHPPILTFPYPSTSTSTSNSSTRPPFPIHPNIHPHTGALCLDLLSSAWSPAYTLSSVCTAAQQVLVSPGLDSPLDVDVAVLLRGTDTGAVAGGVGNGSGRGKALQGDVVAVEGLVRLWAFGGGVG